MISCAISLLGLRSGSDSKRKKEPNLLLVSRALHGVSTPSHPLDGADVHLDRVCYISLIVMAKIISNHLSSMTELLLKEAVLLLRHLVLYLLLTLLWAVQPTFKEAR